MEKEWAPSTHQKDDDGIADLLLHFRMSETGLASGDEEICLTVATHDEVEATGCSPIRIAGDGSGGGKKKGS